MSEQEKKGTQSKIPQVPAGAPQPAAAAAASGQAAVPLPGGSPAIPPSPPIAGQEAGGPLPRPIVPLPQGSYHPDTLVQTKKEPRQYTLREKLLLLMALAGGICYERFVTVWRNPSTLFWLSLLILFYIFDWQRLKKNKVLWYVAGCAVALGIWPLFFRTQEYTWINALVVPGVVVAHIQFAGCGYSLGQPLAVALEWVVAWIIKPFSAINHFFASLFTISLGKGSKLSKVLLGILLSLPLLLFILPLLAGADMVFAYHLRQLLDFNIYRLVTHTIAIAIATILIYSVLWNAGYAKPIQTTKIKESAKADGTVFCGILSMVVLVYALFCGVQFTYLFARAGLPEGMTYSEYAREGFWQLIVIAGINLAIFGFVLQFSKKNPVVTVLQLCLLGMTGVILLSGFLRLRLYITVYHMTWLRLLSAWFLLYLAAVLVLCVVRIVKTQIPLVAICALLLLGWFTVLGYSNPDGFVSSYNAVREESKPETVQMAAISPIENRLL